MDSLRTNPDGVPLLGKKILYDMAKKNRNELLKQTSEDIHYRLAREQEEEAGLYPDHFDPSFVSHLVQKLEFADTISKPYDPNDNPCGGVEDFETTPVQRFVASFLHPSTPYRGMLLYHGVGVGKTCAAILTAEGYLEQFPYKKVIIIAPRNIQPGFYRTIFDPTKLIIGKDDAPNRLSGCLGDLYLHLTNSLFIRDTKKIERDIMRLIKKRYSFYGYVQFANYIRSIVNKVTSTKDAKLDDERVGEAIRREFNYHLLIVDEAHNLRDIDGIAVEEDADTTEADVSEGKAGKLLTPQLKTLLKYAEGMKLMLMTATPMFNSVREIVFLINLFLMNEKRTTLNDGDILEPNGEFKKDAEPVLGKYASAYVSFMRGENPNSFPLRLKPFSHPELTLEPIEDKIVYPEYAPSMIMKEASFESSFGQDEDEIEKIKGMLNLPFKCSPMSGYGERMVAKMTEQRATDSISFTVLDSLIQAGNVVFPSQDGPANENSPEDYSGGAGFEATFTKVGPGARYKVASGDATWLIANDEEGRLGDYSPKCNTIIKLLRNSTGVSFVYSRFVRSGAFFLALALEANGYTAWNRTSSFLIDGNQVVGGRQCARCSKREKEHNEEEKRHFAPAKFALLTGDTDLSPNNANLINASRTFNNIDGSQIKVIIGSQVAAEGLDLKFIREIHILDPWFHLNKTEQIIGRGIRFCSHSAIKDKKYHNATVYLHVTTFSNYPVETADLYSYRAAYKKALQIGKVSRVLKQYAVDCNLRRPATVIQTDETMQVVDSQNNDRGEQNLSDVAYSPLCDWLPDCEINCIPKLTPEQITGIDTSTYSQFTARFRESIIKIKIQELFNAQSAYNIDTFESIVEEQTGAPDMAIAMVMRSIIGNKTHVIKNGSQRGYISIRNGYYVFQPLIYKDKNLPSALRIADLPIKRDNYIPKEIDITSVPTPEQEAVAAEGEIGRPVPGIVAKAEVWSALRTWIENLANKRVSTIVPTVENAIERATEGNKELFKIMIDRLQVIVYFFSLEGLDFSAAKEICLEFVWDKFLGRAEQIKTLQVEDETMKKIGKYILLRSGSIKAMRFLNNETGILDYVCEDMKPCSLAIREAFESDKTEEVKKLVADKTHTGALYGFLSAKRGQQVFKTQAPHPTGGKPDRGQECSYDSAPKEKIERLVMLGKILEKSGMSDLDLKEGVLVQRSREIKNATSYCSLMELVLRYMDNKRVSNKKWFFRSIESYYTKHKFLTISGKKATSKAVTAAKAVKQVKSKRALIIPNDDSAPPSAPPKPEVLEGKEEEEEEAETDVQPKAEEVLAETDVQPKEEEEEENSNNNVFVVSPKKGGDYVIHGGSVFSKKGVYLGNYNEETGEIDTSAMLNE